MFVFLRKLVCGTNLGQESRYLLQVAHYISRQKGSDSQFTVTKLLCSLQPDRPKILNRKGQTQQKLPFPIHDTDLLGAFPSFPSCRGAQVPFPLYSAVQCIGSVAYWLRESSVFSSTYRLPCQPSGDRLSCDRLFPQAPCFP